MKIYILLYLTCIECIVFDKYRFNIYGLDNKIPYDSCIKVNKSSLKDKIKTILIDEGIINEYSRYENYNKGIIIDKIINRINKLYKEFNYIDGYVLNFKLLDCGKLLITCNEGVVYRDHIRFFIKDINLGKDINTFQNILYKSDINLPKGKYKYINNDYLLKKLIYDDILLINDIKLFNILKSIGLYKNLSYVIHKVNNIIYFDIFYDGYDNITSIIPTITIIPKGNFGLSIGYKNINLLDKKCILYASGDFNLSKKLNELKLKFISDTLDLAFWNHDLKNCSLYELSTSLSTSKFTHLTIINHLNDINFNVKYMNRSKDIKLLSSIGINLYNLSLYINLINKFNSYYFNSPIIFNTSILNSIEHNLFKIKSDLKDDNKFRFNNKITFKFNSGYTLDTKILLTKTIQDNDYRGLYSTNDNINKNMSSMLNVIISNDLNIPIILKKLKSYHTLGYSSIYYYTTTGNIITLQSVSSSHSSTLHSQYHSYHLLHKNH